MSSADVDAYVKAKIRPEHQGIVAMLRELMRECAPNAEELVSYGIVNTGRKLGHFHRLKSRPPVSSTQGRLCA